jgi:hypothetical protein
MFRLRIRHHFAAAVAAVPVLTSSSAANGLSSSTSSLTSSSTAVAATALRAQGGAAAPVAAAAGAAAAAPTRAQVWALWNEGNLFSLTPEQLAAFLKANGVDPEGQRKAALVRKTEALMAKEAPASLVVEAAKVDDVSTITATQTARAASDYSATASDLFEEADEYGDWTLGTAATGKKVDLDFIAFSASEAQRESATAAAQQHLAPRAFQLLHQENTVDLGLARLAPSFASLPGCAHLTEAMTPVSVAPDDANRLRFRKGFHWAVANAWNANIDAEINIGAGKALYWRAAAKQQKPVLPLWACQQHLFDAHPYSWLAIAHEDNVGAMEQMAATLGMQPSGEAETSYKLMVRRSRDILDVDLNAHLQTVKVNRPWDRLFVSHNVRTKMPDLRFVVRGRRPMPRKVTEQYLSAPMLKISGATAQSVLDPALGDVAYAAQRVIRRWHTKLASGATLQLVETRRTPLLVTRQGDDGERLEYEFVANVPPQVERVDVHAMADELWTKGQDLAAALEGGMTELHAFTMASAAAFASN